MSFRQIGEIAHAMLEDYQVAILAAMEPENRKTAIMEAYGYGALDSEQVAFMFYVFDLRGA